MNLIAALDANIVTTVGKICAGKVRAGNSYILGDFSIRAGTGEKSYSNNVDIYGASFEKRKGFSAIYENDGSVNRY